MTDTPNSSLPPPPPPTPDATRDLPTAGERIRNLGADERRPIDLTAVGVALAIGVAFDLAVHRRITSVAGALLITTAAVGLLVSGRLDTPQSRRFAAAAPLFGCWLAIRASPWLIPLDVIASVGLLGAAVATSSDRAASSLRVLDVARQPVLFASATVSTIGFVVRGLAGRLSMRFGQVRSAAIGVALMLPIVLLLGGLLASGDALTGELLRAVGVGAGIGHAAAIAVGSWAGLTLVFRAAGTDRAEPAPGQGILRPVEATIVLAGIVTLYSAFAAVQLAGALGAASEILDDPVDTANWARQGFFQLLWAAGLTLSVLVAIDRFVIRQSPSDTRRYRSLVAAAAALTLVVVGVSITRIVRYSDTFGLTMLRLYAALFACWVGAVFVLVAVRARSHARPRWLALRASVVGLALLFGLNAADPEALVVRFDATSDARFDRDYLLSSDLSSGAIPELVATIPDLAPADRSFVEDRLCARGIPDVDGWLSWNRSRAEARSALLELCSP